MPSSVARQVHPAYVAQRVGEGKGAALLEVEVRGVQVPTGLRSGAKRRGRVEEGVVREAVVGHVVEGLRGELVRELMEVVLD
jgi:hypothetical protein